jgi:hypothetical protein
MTGVIRWNKAKTQAGSDGWNLTTDIGTALDTANVIVPVATQAERDGLTPPSTGKYAGMVVARTDIAGIPLEKYDGSAWIRQPITDTSPITNDGNWTISGGLIRSVATGLTQVTASWKMTRTAAAITILTTDSTVIVGAIPTGFRPTWNSSVVVTVNDNVGGRYAEPQLIVNTGGSIVARSTSGGGITIGVGYTIFVSAVWCI